jgi:transcriptional regulator with XRE-family HTH domain
MATARRPTSADVAHRAGVSRATVSYVLNNVPNQSIPDGTRQRVLSAAAELYYTPPRGRYVPVSPSSSCSSTPAFPTAQTCPS